MITNRSLVDALLPALGPCEHLSNGPCNGACRWQPASGHIPRGFGGGKNTDLGEIRLVVVTAEPGDPADGELHSGTGLQMIEAHMSLAEQFLRDPARLRRGGRPAPYHVNMRRILNLCWPDHSVDEQLERTWLTNAVLCSARISGGSVSRAVESTCVETYLRPQLALLPRAFVITLGEKASNRLRRAGIRVDAAAHHPSARPVSRPETTWMRASQEFHSWLRSTS